MQVCISFLEIYNEAGYDLLAPALAAQVVEDLPRVHIMEDDGGQLHMRNLSLHPVASEEEALNLVRSSHKHWYCVCTTQLHFCIQKVPPWDSDKCLRLDMEGMQGLLGKGMHAGLLGKRDACSMQYSLGGCLGEGGCHELHACCSCSWGRPTAPSATRP